MRNKREIYFKLLEDLKKKIIAKYDELGLRASGSFEDELEQEVKGDTLILWGAGHSYFMEHGRDSGGWPPRQAIEDWIDVKAGLPEVFREKKKQFVFLISRKIANEGIQVPNDYNKGKIVSSVVEEFLANEVEKMIDLLGLLYVETIASDVVQTFKQAA